MTSKLFTIQIINLITTTKRKERTGEPSTTANTPFAAPALSSLLSIWNLTRLKMIIWQASVMATSTSELMKSTQLSTWAKKFRLTKSPARRPRSPSLNLMRSQTLLRLSTAHCSSTSTLPQSIQLMDILWTLNYSSSTRKMTDKGMPLLASSSTPMWAVMNTIPLSPPSFRRLVHARTSELRNEGRLMSKNFSSRL